jgi:hypothetical protein
MKLKFKQGTPLATEVQKMYDEKERMHALAVQIIEEETGCKVRKKSQLSSSYGGDINYWWRYDICYFEDGITTVPGYKLDESTEHAGKNRFLINNRTKIKKILERRFNIVIKPVRCKVLEQYGIYTVSDSHWYSWDLIKEENGEISMSIHPAIYGMLDFEKAPGVTVM